MRIPSYRNHTDSRSDQTMTPMIDVVFLLLIFFVCASVGQVRESVLPTELAGGSIESLQVLQPPPPHPLGKVWLNVLHTSEGKSVVEMNKQKYTDFSQLKGKLMDLAELAPEIPVILDIEPDVVLEEMIHVFDICRAAGFESISFAADAEKLKTPPGSGK
jgi:biopolymer transport protein ExbD